MKGLFDMDNGRVGLDRVVALAHCHLGLDVVFLAELTAAGQVYRAVSGDAPSFEIARSALCSASALRVRSATVTASAAQVFADGFVQQPPSGAGARLPLASTSPLLRRAGASCRLSRPRPSGGRWTRPLAGWGSPSLVGL
jgi:hypothetical protein